MLDSLQEAIVKLLGGAALVLAGPGCGKTHILAERIAYATSKYGIDPARMLCLTFTNRAAREMHSRIASITGEKPRGLYVGNIHRFGLRFLLANHLISPTTTVIDDEEAEEFIVGTLGYRRASDIRHFAEVCKFLYQTTHGHPKSLVKQPHNDISARDVEAAAAYALFKEENALIDFDDIILQTYSALKNRTVAENYEMTDYLWVQVDEVQDMTPLQLAIVEMLKSPTAPVTSLYLGDEQQAIFAFTGAGGAALDVIKKVCKGNIIHLERNYRSPRYLVDTCNGLASQWLGTAPELLPSANDNTRRDDGLVAIETDYHLEGDHIVTRAVELRGLYPDESVAILCQTNMRCNEISEHLTRAEVEHLLISQHDVFHRATFRTLYAHLSALVHPGGAHNAWTRILYAVGAQRSMTGARGVIKKIKNAGIAPDELFDPASPGRVLTLASALADPAKTIVVLDTETTGLDVFCDDVVQIAAVKIRSGKEVPDSRFEIFIDTTRDLPRSLSDGTPNPMILEYMRQPKTEAMQALQQFNDYLDDADFLMGHNIGYDIEILRNNWRRHLGDKNIPSRLDKPVIDTMVVSRLLMPRARSHSLTAMAENLGLANRNTHLAMDDVVATAELAQRLHVLAMAKTPEILELAKSPEIVRTAKILSSKYLPFYRASLKMLAEHDPEKHGNSLPEQLEAAYRFYTVDQGLDELPRWNYVSALVKDVITGPSGLKTFRNQVQGLLYELLTFNESDFFTHGIVTERISVMTVHKAKGLEWENVILADTRHPWGTTESAARLFYVAYSRARKRLTVILNRDISAIVQSTLHNFSQ